MQTNDSPYGYDRVQVCFARQLPNQNMGSIYVIQHQVKQLFSFSHDYLQQPARLSQQHTKSKLVTVNM